MSSNRKRRYFWMKNYKTNIERKQWNRENDKRWTNVLEPKRHEEALETCKINTQTWPSGYRL